MPAETALVIIGGVTALFIIMIMDMRDKARRERGTQALNEEKRKHPIEQEQALPALKVERVVIGIGDDGEMIFGEVEKE